MKEWYSDNWSNGYDLERHNLEWALAYTHIFSDIVYIIVQKGFFIKMLLMKHKIGA